jgi:hypothetical protein
VQTVTTKQIKWFFDDGQGRGPLILSALSLPSLTPLMIGGQIECVPNIANSLERAYQAKSGGIVEYTYAQPAIGGQLALTDYQALLFDFQVKGCTPSDRRLCVCMSLCAGFLRRV